MVSNKPGDRHCSTDSMQGKQQQHWTIHVVTHSPNEVRHAAPQIEEHALPDLWRADRQHGRMGTWLCSVCNVMAKLAVSPEYCP